MRTATILFAAALSLLAGLPAVADERLPQPLREAAARLLDGARLFALDSSFRADMRMAGQGLKFPDDLPADAVTELTALEANLQEKARMPFRETLIDIYAARLSKQQLDEAADFFTSPAGQARATVIELQATRPELHSQRAFGIDETLQAMIDKAASERGLMTPKPN